MLREVRRATLQIKMIRLDFQPSENLIQETVHDYTEQLRRGEKFAPVIVRFDGKSYFCQDGFHRLEAARRSGRDEIEVEIFDGTLADMDAEFGLYLARLKASLKDSAK